MLVQALREIGIEKFNDLQRVAIPKVAEGRNVLITAPTGSGKTECAVIPILNRMLRMDCKGVTFLYVTPLRALNRDMVRRLKFLAERLGFSIAVRHGDTPNSERRLQSLNPPQIMITTPETLQILLLGKRLRSALSNVRFVVIDEVHELADSKRGVQLAVALERLGRIAKFQRIGLSATLSNAKEIAKYFGFEEVLEWNAKKRYEFRVLRGEVEDIVEILRGCKSALIFTNTRQSAEYLGVKLRNFLEVEVHHSSLSRDVRVNAERRFAEGKLKALICTSSMELGIDVGHVDVVIQFNSPREVRRLIQRVGRSRHRLDEVSKGYIVANNLDDYLESIAIVERAKRGLIEPVVPYDKPLDVLANQILAMLLEGYRIEEIFDVVKRVKFYEDLTWEEFKEVCDFLEENRLILNGRITRKGRKHFYSNLSMIPDERKVKVIDVTTRKVIGYLDENFLSLDHSVFAMKGELWRIVAIDDAVMVERVDGEGVIPSWIGEEIPVPYEVAKEAGRLRKEFKDEVIEETLKRGFAIPDDRTITIEGDGNVVVNACFGHRVNETLSKLLSLFLPKPFEIRSEPYRIWIKGRVDADYVKDVLTNLNVEDVERLLELALIDSKVMQYKFVEVAKRFGCIGEVERVNVRKLLEKMRDTVVYRETLKELLHERIDIERTVRVLRDIQEGRIRVFTFKELSPISKLGDFGVGDVVGDRERAILKAFRERLEREKCYLLCLNCGCKLKLRVDQIEDTRCIKCRSVMVACVNARRDLNDLSREELYRSANLVMNYGKRAIYALNTLGVGVNTAVKILSKPYRSEDDFFKELMEAEKRFVRTRLFWS